MDDFVDLNIIDENSDVSFNGETWLLEEEENDLIILDSVDLSNPEPLKDIVNIINDLVPENKAQISILQDQQWNEVLNKLGPKNFLARGLGKHFNILIDPRQNSHVLVGPGAVGSVADKNRTGTSEVVYAIINATGQPSNEIFERGCADIIAGYVAEKSGISFYTNNYPGEAQFVKDLINSFKEPEDDEFDWVLMLKNNPDQFFNTLEKSKFFKWWEKFAHDKDVFSHFVHLIESLKSPNGQLNGSFLQWAQTCAHKYAEYNKVKLLKDNKKSNKALGVSN